jgi:CBS domain-containing protein
LEPLNQSFFDVALLSLPLDILSSLFTRVLPIFTTRIREDIMQVSEIMHKGVITVQINDSIKRVAALMKREDIGAVPVFKNERPVGFVTDRDIVISCIAQGHPIDDPISHAMKGEIIYVHEDDDVSVATRIMRENQISRLMVVDKGENPVGMLSLHDLLNIPDEHLKSETVSKIKH